MSQYSTYVGMDVHARSITCQSYDVETGETKTKVLNNAPTPAEVASWLSSLSQPVYCAYESGCTAFELCRGLRELGMDCDVIAVSTLAKSDKAKKSKCDKLDAKSILAAILNPMSEHTCVWCPDEETEGARDLARMRDEAAQALKRARQQLLALLLRHGHVWNEKTATGKPKAKWGRDFMRWLDGIELGDSCSQKALEFYKRMVEASSELAKEAREAVDEAARSPRWKPYVDALGALKGVSVPSAFLIAAEFGDFTRFESGRKVSCWLGTVPKNNSSGEKESHGGITKAGNSRLRRTLVEGNAAIALRTAGKKALGKDQVVSAAVKRMADKANARLAKRYQHLTKDNGLRACKARIAVVNEQIRWCWAIGVAVHDELARDTR